MKRMSSALLCFCLLFASMVFPASVSATESILNQQMSKGVLLYVGYNGYYGTKYHTPTDDALRLLLSTTDEILLIPIVTYNRYTDANGNIQQILTNDVINNMTADMVGTASRLNIIKSEYLEDAAERIAANYHMDDYINDSAELGRRLVALNPNVKLWYSVPQADCFHALTHLFADAWVSVVDGVKEELGDDIWNNNVQGFYYSGEDIVTAGYTKFDTSVPDQNFNNPIVYAMRQVSDRVHYYGKNMLWIPYYHSEASSSTNLGYVANKTNIFDTVILQPSYYFMPARSNGLTIIKNSVESQAVLNASGSIIGGSKTSDTKIGFEMEIDERYYSNSAYRARYKAYVDVFSHLVGEYPTAFYAGRPDVMLTLTQQMTAFFRGEAATKYTLPTNDISAWYGERTADSSYGYSWHAPLAGDEKSDEISGAVTTNGDMRLTLTGNFQYPVARVENSSGLIWFEQDDYINLDVTLEGESGGINVRWGVDLYFVNGHININEYIAEAEDTELYTYSQLRQGRYRVSLQVGPLLKAYDADNGLTGSNSMYEKVFGENGNTALTQVWFSMFCNTPASYTDVGLVINSFTVTETPMSPTYSEVIDMYSLPVDSIDQWETWESSGSLSESQTINSQITDEGVRLSFADGATDQFPVAFVRNYGGLIKLKKGDKLNVDVTLEGESGGRDIRWVLQLQFASAGVTLMASDYIGEAAGFTADAYHQLPQGDYNVTLDIEQLLKDYDSDNNLTGADSFYEKIFGENGSDLLTNINFTLVTNVPGTTDQDYGLVIRNLSVTRTVDFYEPEIRYALPVSDITAWLAERTSDSPYGYSWNAPLIGDEKSNEISGEVTNDGAMRLSLTGNYQYPVARVQNNNGLIWLEESDYLNIDVTLEGLSGDTNVRWGLDLCLSVGMISLNKYIAEAAGVETYTYSQLRQGTYTVSLNVGEVLKAYDADNNLTGSDSMYEKVFDANGNRALTQIWFTMYSNTPEQYTNVGLVIDGLTITDGTIIPE